MMTTSQKLGGLVLPQDWMEKEVDALHIFGGPSGPQNEWVMGYIDYDDSNDPNSIQRFDDEGGHKRRAILCSEGPTNPHLEVEMQLANPT